MATKTKKKQSAQQQLFQSESYEWKSVQGVTRGDRIVIATQETTVLSVRQFDGSWWISYHHPATDEKIEEFYPANAFVYVRQEQEAK